MLKLNGQVLPAGVAQADTILSAMRDHLGLKGAKEGCGRGECGACTVLLDGVPVMACITYVGAVDGEVETVEALQEEARDLRKAFARFGGFQCGFCTAGQIVHSLSVLRELAVKPVPDADVEAFVRHRMSGNICRCTGYNGIIDAIVHTYHARSAHHAERAA